MSTTLDLRATLPRPKWWDFFWRPTIHEEAVEITGKQIYSGETVIEDTSRVALEANDPLDYVVYVKTRVGTLATTVIKEYYESVKQGDKVNVEYVVGWRTGALDGDIVDRNGSY